MRILLVQTSFLGDTILSTPLIAGIKRLYPQCELWVLTTPAARSIIEHDPLVSGVLQFEKRGAHAGIIGLIRFAKQLRSYGFSRAYAVQRSYRTALLLFLARIPFRVGFKNAALSFLFQRQEARPDDAHDVIRNLALLRGEGQPADWSLPLEERFSTELRLFVAESAYNNEKLRDYLFGNFSYVVLFPGSAWLTKMWHCQEYRRVAQNLLQRGLKVLLLGSATEKEVCGKVSEGLAVENLAGMTSINETMALVQHAKSVVCNDSMALHLASAFKVPTVAVFCATSPRFGFGPWQNTAEVVERGDLACKPCRRHGSNKCPTGTQACMRDLPAERVLEALGRVSNGALQ